MPTRASAGWTPSTAVAWVTGASARRSAARGRPAYRRPGPDLAGRQPGHRGDGLNFRDVEASSADVAVVLAIGNGEASRVYRTTDGGQTWTETFRNTDEAAFYNCMDFYPGGRRGLAVSDAVDGKFRIIATEDGGRSWEVLPSDGMPDSTGEYNFSASGDCLVIRGKHAWFGSGGAAVPGLPLDRPRAAPGRRPDSTIPAGEAAGVFGLAFKNPRHGIAVGGDFAAPDGRRRLVGVHPQRPHLARRRRPEPARGGRRLAVGHRGRVVLVTGESGETAGTDVSFDDGRTWHPLTDLGYHTLDCTRTASCWAAGSGGRVARLRY